MKRTKEYLGDGVYVEPDGGEEGIWLSTHDVIDETNKIFIEPEVWKALLAYVEADGYGWGV